MNASIKRTCSTIFQTQMSDTSSDRNYSPLPLSPAPSEVLKEDPYEACSDEEDNDEEDASMKFRRWVPLGSRLCMRVPALVTKKFVTAWRIGRMRTAILSVVVAIKAKAKHIFIATK